KGDNRLGFVTVASKVDETSFEAVAGQIAEPGVTVAPFKGPMSDWGCARGISEGLAAVIGNDVIAAEEKYKTPLQLRLTWTVSASGSMYSMPSVRRAFPGIAIDGELELADGDTRIAAMPV